MRNISNDERIERNKRLSQILSLVGMVILISGPAYLLLNPLPEDAPPGTPVDPTLTWVPMLTLMLGFILSQIGMHLANRFVRSPRPHEAIDKALKGLGDDYDLYHYFFPASHVLFSPAGVHVIITRFQDGAVSWHAKRKRLIHKGGSWFRSVFGQESMGQPTLELKSEIDAVDKFLRKHLPEEQVPPVHGVLLMLNPEMQIGDVQAAPMPVLHLKKLKEYIRKQPKGHELDLDQIDILEEAIGLE